MKKILTTILTLGCISSAIAQTDTTTTDSTTVRVGKKSITISTDGVTVNNPAKRAKAKGCFRGVGFGLNLLATREGDVTLPNNIRQWENEPIRSMTWNLNFYDAFIPITTDRHSLGLVTGLGLTYRSFGFNAKDQEMVTDENGTSLQDNIDGLKYDKRKFRVTYISAPALVAFNTSTNIKKNFHLSAGVIGNIRIGSLYKRKYNQDDDQKKLKNRSDFNLNPLSADFTVRAGYRGVTFFFNYGLTPLFRSGKGPELIPMTFGVQL
ncbi:MAG: outer membrane beta-barrel protein [Bacteroidota bacterium]